jgi:3-methylcrotonyl-CoA carboxylase alpha subunit
LKLSCGDESREIRLEGENAAIGGRRVAFRVSRTGGRLEAIRIGERAFPVRVSRERDRVFVWCAGQTLEFRRAGSRPRRSREESGSLAAPMPGRIRKILAVTGRRVAPGDVVLILEAMKMEHAIRAPAAGTVTKIFHSEGDLVEAGTLLAEIKENL